MFKSVWTLTEGLFRKSSVKPFLEMVHRRVGYASEWESHHLSEPRFHWYIEVSFMKMFLSLFWNVGRFCSSVYETWSSSFLTVVLTSSYMFSTLYYIILWYNFFFKEKNNSFEEMDQAGTVLPLLRYQGAAVGRGASWEGQGPLWRRNCYTTRLVGLDNIGSPDRPCELVL